MSVRPIEAFELKFLLNLTLVNRQITNRRIQWLYRMEGGNKCEQMVG